MKQRHRSTILSAVLVVVALGGGVGWFWRQEKAEVKDTKIVQAQTYTVKAEHPRIWLTTEKLAILKARAGIPTGTPTKQWTDFKAHVNGYMGAGQRVYGGIWQYSLVYQITGNISYADKAIDEAIALIDAGRVYAFQTTAYRIIEVGMVFDWTFDRIEERGLTSKFIAYLEDMTDWLLTHYENNGFHNIAFLNMQAEGFAGYSLYGHSTKAQIYIDHARYRLSLILSGLNIYGAGGGMSEGEIYGEGNNLSLLRYLKAVKSATGEDLFSSHPYIEEIVYDQINAASPNVFDQYNGTYYYRKIDRRADIDFRLAVFHDYRRNIFLMFAEEFALRDSGKLAQWFINHQNGPGIINRMNYSWMRSQEFLWYNPEIPEISWDNLELAYFEKGVGRVYMRSSWDDENATWIAFQCGDHFTVHQHWDQNSFTIYKFDELAIDSGVYDSWASSHMRNYARRTVAHNTILVYDPNENFYNACSWDGAAANDGGQHNMIDSSGGLITSPGTVEEWNQRKQYYDTGDIKGYEHNQDYTYILGGATNAYANIYMDAAYKARLNSEKLTNFTRQFLYLRPQNQGDNDYVVIFDRVGSSNASFQKTWLLHSINAPQVNLGGVWTTVSSGIQNQQTDYLRLDNGRGRLFVKSLLPDSKTVRTIGGAGYEYWTNGQNYPTYPNSGEYGKWRIEVQPAVAQKDDIFLHVFYPTDTGKDAMPEASKIESATNNMVGTLIADPSGPRIVMFSQTETKETGGLAENIIYNISGAGNSKHLVVDLKPNTTFTVQNRNQDTGQVIETQTKTSSSQGTLYFETLLGSNHQIAITPGTTPPPPQPPNITLTKTVLVNGQPASEAAAGDELTYTITYINTGSGEAKNITITDNIPSGTQYVADSATGSPSFSNNTLTWTIAFLAPGASGTVSFKAKVE